MNIFPNQILIKIKNIETGQPISNIAVQIRLFALHKNDYICIPSLSDSNGIIEVTKDWLNKEIEQSRNLFIMDYSSTLSDCKPQIEIKIMNSDEVKRTVQAWKEWKNILDISQIAIDGLSGASNEKYDPLSKIININGEETIETELLI